MISSILNSKYFSFGALIISGLWLVLLYLRIPHLVWHSGILMAWFTDKGLVMYKDFLNFYFPLSTYFVLPFFKLTNWNLETEPFLSLLLGLFTLILLFKISIRFLSPLGTTLCLFFYAVLFYYFTTAIQYTGEAITGLFLLLAFNIVINFKNLPGNLLQIVVIGFLISLTLLFNQISALSLTALTIYFLFMLFKTSKKYYLNNFLFFAFSALLPIILVTIYFFQKGALFDLIHNNFTYYFNYIMLARGSGDLSNLPWNEILFFYTPAVAAFAILLNKSKEISTNTFSILLLLLSVSLISIPSVIFSVFHRHHFLYALPLVALLFGLVFELGIKYKKIPAKIITLLAGTFIIYQFVFTIYPWYSERIILGKSNYIANDILPGDSMHMAVNWVEENTKPMDKLLVAGDGLFYLKADRLPSAKFFTVLPWHYKPVEQTATVIRDNRPEYWVISSSYLKRVSSPQGWNSPEITEFINAELKDCYLKTASFPDWEIWQKNCK